MQIKRVFAICLALVMLLVVAGCAGDNGKTGDILTYTLSADGSSYEVVAERANNLTTQAITVPATYEGKPVVIPYRAFYALPELTSVTIEGAAGEIAAQAFMNCPKLETVVLKGKATVAAKCFSSCAALQSITFGEGISEIGSECISNCPELTRVVIGDDCKAIGYKAFAGCQKLTDLTLGKGLTSIGMSAFTNTISLKSVSFPTEQPLLLDSYAFSYSGIEELHIPGNVQMKEYVFDHLAWDNGGGYSRCRAVYFYAEEPTVENLGTNAIGYTWDRTAEQDPQLGDFCVYVPEDSEEIYITLMEEECDESWNRCVLSVDKLKTFTP